MKWFIIVVLAGVVLAVPHALRFAGDNNYPAGSAGYGILREAALVRSASSLDSFTGESIMPDLHTYLIAGFLGIMPPFLAARILPFVAGLLAAALFFALARKLMKERAAAVAGILFVLSPAFIFIFSTFNRWYLTVVLVLFTLLFFVEKKTVLCAVVSGLVLLASPLAFVLLAATFFVRPPEDWRRFIMVLGPFVLAAAVIYGVFAGHVVLPLFAFSPYIVDFGAPFGIDVAFLILGAIGIAFVRKRISIALIILLAGAFFNPLILIFACLLLPLSAGLAGAHLLERSWSLPNLKQLTLLVIACTILFSVTSYEKQLAKAEPTPFFVRAVENIPESDGVVLAPQVYAPYIQYFAGRRVGSPHGNDSLERIYQSRDLKTTEALLNAFQIDTFFVTKDMRQGLVWDRGGEGLDFLLPHSDRFVNLYLYKNDQVEYEVWAYRPKSQ